MNTPVLSYHTFQKLNTQSLEINQNCNISITYSHHPAKYHTFPLCDPVDPLIYNMRYLLRHPRIYHLHCVNDFLHCSDLSDRPHFFCPALKMCFVFSILNKSRFFLQCKISFSQHENFQKSFISTNFDIICTQSRFSGAYSHILITDVILISL